MDNLSSVLDPSDWLNTKLPPLYQFDSMIRCHICKEFMTSPVLTGCGHCFCSLCIRSTIATIGKCPLCNEEQIESKLRRNLILEEIIIFFKKYRSDLLVMLSKDDKLEESTEVTSDVPELINLDSDDEDKKRSSSPISDTSIRKKARRPISVTDQLTQPVHKQENLSECPICHDFFPMHEIETTHIDFCLSNNDKPKKSTKKTTLSNFFVKKPVENKKSFTFDKNKQYQMQNTNNKKPLKKLDYSSMNTTKLKEKLSLLSLPLSGTRQQLETRYNQYVILYNSNLDSLNPEPLKKLRATLNQWEFLNNNMDSNLIVTTKQKNVDRSNWSETYNDEFKKLIAQAKMKLKLDTSKEDESVDDVSVMQDQDVSSGPPVDTSDNSLREKMELDN